jgi:hypothetical protein
MKCKRHPKYRAVRRPAADCFKCRLIYEVLDFLGRRPARARKSMTSPEPEA